MVCKHFWTAVLFLALILLPKSVWSQQIDWFTGSDLDRQATEAAMSVNWREAPLRDRLNELAQRQKIGIYLDRRVDGSQLIKFSVSDVSFEEFLWRLCEQLNVGMCRIENLYYVGPKETAAQLPMMVSQLQSQIKQTNGRAKDKWLRKSAISIGYLAEPRQLIQELTEGLNAKLDNLEEVPHDLWGKCDLPQTSGVAKLAIMVIGFELQFRGNADMSAVQFIPAKYSSEVIREFKTGDKTNRLNELLSTQFPDAELTKNRRSVTAKADPKTILDIDRYLASTHSPEVASLSDQRFSLKGETTRTLILKEIAKSLSRDLQIAPAVAGQLEARIQLDVQEVTIETLIEKSLEGTNLNFQITDDALIIE